MDGNSNVLAYFLIEKKELCGSLRFFGGEDFLFWVDDFLETVLTLGQLYWLGMVTVGRCDWFDFR